MTTASRARAVAVALASAVLAASCGGDDPARPAFEATRAWTWHESDGNGYDARTRFELGEFVALDAVPRLPGFDSFGELADSCLFHEERDAIAPVAVDMTNGSGAAAPVLSTQVSRANGVTYGGTGMGTELLLVTSDGDGVACGPLGRRREEHGTTWTPGWRAVAPGATTDRAHAYLIIRNYFVPNSPKGSAELRLSRSFLDAGDARSGSWVTSVEGPGRSPLVFDDSRMVKAFFDLSGTRPPCGHGDMVVRCKN